MAQEAPKAKPAAAPAAAAETPAASGASGWMPVIAVVVAVPLLSIATAKFVLYPAIDQRIAAAVGGGGAPAAGAHAPAAGEHASSGSSHGEAGAEGEATQSYEFKNIVSNLAGAMKSRYIKVTFTVYGSDPKFTELIEHNKAKLLDATLGVLGSLTLSEMEDAGAKNKIRTSLAQAYQTVLRARLVEEVYFSEFVIQ